MDSKLKVGKLYRVDRPKTEVTDAWLSTTTGLGHLPTTEWEFNSRLRHGAVVMYLGTHLSDGLAYGLWHLLLSTDAKIHYIYAANEDDMYESLTKVKSRL